MDPKIVETRWKKDFESVICKEWKDSKVYSFNSKSKKPVYSIDTPPPYVNAPIHMGHACTYVMMDMFARFKRMSGFNVVFPLGLDRNGLPIEMAAEKKFKVKLTSVSRVEALDFCRRLLEESAVASIDSFYRCGISFNEWSKSDVVGSLYETDSDEYRALTQATFIDLWNKGLVYEDNRINNWCPGCQTTLADAEIEYEDLQSAWNKIIFKVKESGEDIVIGTTRPELVCTCAMVIFNPADERYKHLDGKTALTPIFNKSVPIRAHPLAQMDKGTGLMMMCSAGDTSDIRFFREQNLPLVIAINKNGTMNEHAGFLSGLHVKAARKRFVEELQSKGLLVEQSQLVHRTPVCERSKDPIEFIEMSELYVKQVEFKDDLRRVAGELNFFDSSARSILLNWIDSVSIDWPISRRRYYATEIPLWWCNSCKKGVVPMKGGYVRPWMESCPVKCSCGSSDLVGETRVFDTWFDSSNSPLFILKYGSKFFEKSAPCSLRPQGKEIIRTWLYYSLLKAFLLDGATIFKDVWINYHIVDESGKKMSKSKGNTIDPKEVLDRFGAEPLRLWVAIEGNITQGDLRCSFDRIDGANKTLSKLWNVARFVSMFPQGGKKPSCVLDFWIIGELNRLVKFARERFEMYDFHSPVVALKHFIWESFSSHYVELVKNRAYNADNSFSKADQDSALWTLHYCLDVVLKLLAPVVPFISARLFSDLRGKNVHDESFPDVLDVDSVDLSVSDVESLNSAIWKAKKDSGVSLKVALKELCVPVKFKSISADLSAAHGGVVSFGELNIKV